MRHVIMIALLATSVLARPADVPDHWQTNKQSLTEKVKPERALVPERSMVPENLLEPQRFLKPERPEKQSMLIGPLVPQRKKLLLKIPNTAGQDWYNKFKEYEFDLFLDEKVV